MRYDIRMPVSAASSPAPSRQMDWRDLSTSATVLLLAALAVFLALARLGMYRDPPGWDVSTYAVIAHKLNSGGKLYLDAWDIKPPAIFATYALAQRIAGWNLGHVYLLSVGAAIFTMLGIFTAASVRGRAAGFWAAALWSAACFAVPIGGPMPNTEAFINSCMIWAVAILLWWEMIPRKAVAAIVVGLLLGLASLYKQVALAPAALLLAGHLACAPRGNWRRAAIHVVLATCAIATTWLLTFAYFALTARAWILYATLFTYAHFYAGRISLNLLHAFRPSRLLPWNLHELAPLLVAALLLVVPLRRARPARQITLLALLALGTLIAVALPGKFNAHYYQLWLPVLALAGGWGIARFIDLRELPSSRRLAQVFGIALALALFMPQTSWYGLSTRTWWQRRNGSWFPRCYDDVQQVNQLLRPGQKLFVWADEPWVYFETRHPLTAPAIFKTPTLEGPLAPWLAQRCADQLRRDPPQLILDWAADPAPPDNPISKLLAERYHRLQDKRARWPFVFYVLNNDVDQ